MAQVYISVGANLDDPAVQVRKGIEALRRIGEVAVVSPLYRTKPWGSVKNQPDFVNAALALYTQLSPNELLIALKAIEREFGRDTQGERYGPRVIDFDILTYDDIMLDEPHLRIPHQHMMDRPYVLVPLADIDPHFVSARDALLQSERDTVIRL